MKKLLALLTTLLIPVGISACSSDDSDTDAFAQDSGPHASQNLEHPDPDDLEQRQDVHTADDDIQQITFLMESMTIRGDRSAEQYFEDSVNNTCSTMLSEEDKASAIESYRQTPDEELESTMESMPQDVQITNIDVHDDGTAVATISYENEGEVRTQDTSLVNEDGQWKYC